MGKTDSPAARKGGRSNTEKPEIVYLCRGVGDVTIRPAPRTAVDENGVLRGVPGNVREHTIRFKRIEEMPAGLVKKCVTLSSAMTFLHLRPDDSLYWGVRHAIEGKPLLDDNGEPAIIGGEIAWERNDDGREMRPCQSYQTGRIWSDSMRRAELFRDEKLRPNSQRQAAILYYAHLNGRLGEMEEIAREFDDGLVLTYEIQEMNDRLVAEQEAVTKAAAAVPTPA